MKRVLDEVTTQRFEAALRAGDFRDLVAEFRSQGISQVEIYDLFETFWLTLREGDRESDEVAVEDAMDFIWGWCRREAMWFDRCLTQMEVDEFRACRKVPS